METPKSTEPITLVRADRGRRFLAYIIDAVVAGVLTGVGSIVNPMLGSLAGAAYILLRDGMGLVQTGGKSVGKYLMKLQVVRLDGEKMDMETSLRRNWTIGLSALTSFGYGRWGVIALVSLVATVLFLYEAYRVLTDNDGRRLGDEQAKTLVVDMTE